MVVGGGQRVRTRATCSGCRDHSIAHATALADTLALFRGTAAAADSGKLKSWFPHNYPRSEGQPLCLPQQESHAGN